MTAAIQTNETIVNIALNESENVISTPTSTSPNEYDNADIEEVLRTDVPTSGNTDNFVDNAIISSSRQNEPTFRVGRTSAFTVDTNLHTGFLKRFGPSIYYGREVNHEINGIDATTSSTGYGATLTTEQRAKLTPNTLVWARGFGGANDGLKAVTTAATASSIPVAGVTGGASGTILPGGFRITSPTSWTWNSGTQTATLTMSSTNIPSLEKGVGVFVGSSDSNGDLQNSLDSSDATGKRRSNGYEYIKYSNRV